MKGLYFFTRNEKIGSCILLALVITSFFVNTLYDGESRATSFSENFKSEINEYKAELKKDEAKRESMWKKKEKQNVLTSQSNKTTYGNAPKQQFFQPKKRFDGVIELNTADTSALTKVKGIGPAFSNRIVKFRNYLGGYYSVEQLREVYGMTDELYNSIKKHFEVDKSKIRKFSVNADSFSYKFRHPYLDRDNVKAILKIKKNNKGEKISNDQLKELLQLPEEKWTKLSNYLD